ncbi:c-type cytochrome [Mucilaginibacter flavidus]|uniref:c-type cytochrome n=1 Tax=Mucilaginibacter flavidus TaxID=2949309 RepID=UPI00209243B8|nr:cytochrome c [Mucilaginibacter flavidus]MCO5948458.1 cytochrome c [Mucilaginibacter flavidus]
MKKFEIKPKTWLLIAGITIVIATVSGSCVESKKIALKSGAQLWSENCQRCHNTPSPTSFSHQEWITVGMHMQTRAQLTDKERDKIIAFLCQ